MSASFVAQRKDDSPFALPAQDRAPSLERMKPAIPAVIGEVDTRVHFFLISRRKKKEVH
jgi:hypothetical protein